ncbi:MAG TPA: MGMT family protein [Thermoanaerobaculia bacterium]|nr:MGMT family protein [Thermoanaerobaculia bacterium]
MRCESALIRLDELRTGELDSREVEAVREHLERCGYCDRVYHRIADIAENARALRGECPSSCAESLERRLFDAYTTVTIGGIDLWVAFSERGLTAVALAAGRSFESFAWSHCKRCGKELRRAELPERLERQLRDALAGRGVDHPQVDLEALPEFEREVLDALGRIPNGEVRSYAWVAREVGRPAAVRAVGNVCAHNPVPLVVPCHRVVPAAGGLGGYAYGSEMKRRLLEREGVDVERVERLGRAKAKYVKVDEWYCFPTCRHARSIAPDALVPVRDEREAAALGLEPCSDCRPLVSAA